MSTACALTTSRNMRRASGCWFLSGWNSRARRRYDLRICAEEAPERRPSVSYGSKSFCSYARIAPPMSLHSAAQPRTKRRLAIRNQLTRSRSALRTTGALGLNPSAFHCAGSDGFESRLKSLASAHGTSMHDRPVSAKIEEASVSKALSSSLGIAPLPDVARRPGRTGGVDDASSTFVFELTRGQRCCVNRVHPAGVRG